MKQFEQMSKMMKMMQGPGGKNLMKIWAEWKECQAECKDNFKV
jgi:signal recognition particle subunit SRP54